MMVVRMAERSMAGQKILVVDDDSGILKLIVAMLRRGGYTPLEANGGAQALELHQSEHPDIVLLDLLMPGMDGFTVLGRMRDYDAAHDRRTLIILLTAHAQSYALEHTEHGFSPELNG
ncbi:MAG: response regulator, partial [Anaerolineae bacterium]|nr:response regulator [Anaerolineae bacterium]